MISERTLKRWRRDALKGTQSPDWDKANANYIREVSERILRLTQELMDLYLIQKGR